MIARALSRFVVLIIVSAAAPAAAQPLGTFRWQLQPYCNVVTLAVTQIGAQYRFEGFDDQCGAAQRAAVTGLAVANADGTLEFGWTIVTAAGPQHVDVTFSIGPLGGPWRDNGGNSGTLVFNPGAVSGPPRPGGLGAIAINPAQVQTRVTGSCGAGQYMRGVNSDGTVSCGTDASGAGTITSVTAGTGLTGGGPSGAVTLSALFGGSGSAGTVARSDHTHQVGAALNENMAVGPFAMSGGTAGSSNTAVGDAAMSSASTGSNNTALGQGALRSVGSGANNTGIGQSALGSVQSGSANTAVGRFALTQNGTGSNNTAIGFGALTGGGLMSSANDNIGIGAAAGSTTGIGSNNIYIGHAGVAADNNAIRIGKSTHTAAYLQGVFGQAVDFVTGTAVFVDFNGRIGSINSSRRYKDDIATMGSMAAAIGKLRPVTFRYKQAASDGTRPLQFGLIAEEVDEVLPELVLRGGDGQIESVKYHLLPTLLLGEVQRLERERQTLTDQVAAQARELAALRALMESIVQRR